MPAGGHDFVPPVAVYGDNCIDRYVVPNLQDFVGGNAVNVAIHLVAQGATVAYFGVTGDDLEGELVRRALVEHGIDCTHLDVREGETAVTWIEVHQGERFVMGDKAGVQCPLSLSPEGLTALAKYKVVHCPAFTAWNVSLGQAQPYLPKEIRYLAQNGVFVSVDFSELERSELAMVAGADIGVAFISRGPKCSDDVLLRTFDFFRGYGIPQVVITLGSDGAAFIEEGELTRLPSRSAAVVDTLGAGDAFIAGWLYGWLTGDGPRQRMLRAIERAGSACEVWGAWPQPAQSGQPQR